MKRAVLYGVLVAFAAAAVLIGCAPLQSEKSSITRLLVESGYTDDAQAGNYGANDTTLEQPDSTSSIVCCQRIPFVRFRRYIPARGVERMVDVRIPADSGGPDSTALATITWTITGELRTCFDTTTNPICVWRKPFTDVATRKVYLEKYDDRWHIVKLSPLVSATQDPAYHLNITNIHAVSSLSHDTFDLSSADTLLTKEELPWFEPGDTVDVTVTVQSDDDSCWVFLHHGRAGAPRVWREPYLKRSTWRFERKWLVGMEAYERPDVRPSIHDAIGWGTLWADSSQPYVAAAWGIPYIVRMPADTTPGDE
ncbi:hypothetical protein JXD38_02570 [candidate division WOR-3 bacterium]|nr:hypothetical protein [candidate division WOR-3 bacterium]